MDGLFNDTGPHAYLGRITEDDNWQHNIPNAWMASSPGHPFWMFCLMEIARASTWLRCDANDCTRCGLDSADATFGFCPVHCPATFLTSCFACLTTLCPILKKESDIALPANRQ